jgi:hypothetical protein
MASSADHPRGLFIDWDIRITASNPKAGRFSHPLIFPNGAHGEEYPYGMVKREFASE